MTDVETERILEETVAIHLFELLKYNLKEAELATAVASDRWLCWLLNSHEYTSDELLKLFSELAIQRYCSHSFKRPSSRSGSALSTQRFI